MTVKVLWTRSGKQQLCENSGKDGRNSGVYTLLSTSDSLLVFSFKSTWNQASWYQLLNTPTKHALFPRPNVLVGPEIWLKNRWSFQRFRWPPMFETDNVNKETTTTITKLTWIESHMQNHHFCIICRQHGNCKGMTHLSLVWAVTSIPGRPSLISICTVPAILWPRGIYVCSTWDHILVWRKHETTGSWPKLIFSWRLVFSVCPFFWAWKTFHHGCTWPNRTRS